MSTSQGEEGINCVDTLKRPVVSCSACWSCLKAVDSWQLHFFSHFVIVTLLHLICYRYCYRYINKKLGFTPWQPFCFVPDFRPIFYNLDIHSFRQLSEPMISKHIKNWWPSWIVEKMATKKLSAVSQHPDHLEGLFFWYKLGVKLKFKTYYFRYKMAAKTSQQ